MSWFKYFLLVVFLLPFSLQAQENTSTTTPPLITGEVNIVVESLAQKPSFYLGRSEPIIGSQLHLTAIPYNFDRVDTSGFRYHWVIDGEAIMGTFESPHQTISYTAPAKKDILVRLKVFTENDTLFSETTEYIRTSKPLVQFYEYNPLRGLSKISIGEEYQLIGEEIKISAVPYFMDTDLQGTDYKYEWRVNNTKIKNSGGDRRTITLQRIESDINSYQIDFTALHPKKLSQYITGRFKFNF